MSQHILPAISRVDARPNVRKFRRSDHLIPRLRRMLEAAALATALAMPLPLAAEPTKPAIIGNSNWSATDDLGRKLPTFEETGPPKGDRWVGLFYSL